MSVVKRKIEEESRESRLLQYYQESQQNPNNMSNWLPQVKDCGILMPKTCIIPVPVDVVKSFYDSTPENEKATYDWVLRDVIPARQKLGVHLLFIKNGTYSNKYDFASCNPTPDALSITTAIRDINYCAMMYGAGGETELVLRERLFSRDMMYGAPADLPKCYEIYHGMPLRTEYRVFYDFDTHKVLHVHNYWDKDYCLKTISRGNYTDGVVFELAYPAIEAEFEAHKGEVCELVDTAMKNVEGLTGQWSIDIMTLDNQYYLIDMALAQQSAYWNPEYLR